MKIRILSVILLTCSLIFLNSCIYKTSNMYGYNEVLGKDTILGSVMKINAPMFILKPILRNELRKEGESEEIIALMNKVRDIKITIINGTANTLDLERKNAKSLKSNLVDWFSMKSDDKHITLRTKEKRGKIKKLELNINSPESSILINIKGKFTADDIVQLVNLSAAKEL